MRYLLRTNTDYEHLAKKFKRAVLTHVGRDGLEMAIFLRRFFVCYRLLASENGLYELANTFSDVGPDLQVQHIPWLCHNAISALPKYLIIITALQRVLTVNHY